MPRKAKTEKEDVINAALKIIRENGADGLTARKLGPILNVAPSSIFTHFSTMDEILSEAKIKIRKIYESYIDEGLSIKPAYKGYGLAITRFAKEEPNLFIFLFLKKNKKQKLSEIVDLEGHKTVVTNSIKESFILDDSQVEKYSQDMWLYICGIASLIASSVCSFTDEEISALLSNASNSFYLAIKAGADEHIGLIPGNNSELLLPPSDYYKIVR